MEEAGNGFVGGVSGLRHDGEGRAVLHRVEHLVVVDAISGKDLLIGVLHANGMADFVQHGAKIDRAVVQEIRVHEHGAGRNSGRW